MPVKSHIIICEGESERAYIQRLQGFLDDLPLPDGEPFATPLRFIPNLVGTGSFGKLTARYKVARLSARNNSSIQIWTDFDLYHRNDRNCAHQYAAKPPGIPHFLFSYHNFEDFFALHFNGPELNQWLAFGSSAGQNHFATPLHSGDFVPAIKAMFPGYSKGALAADFVSWSSLRNLKANLQHEPSWSNPHQIQDLRSFAQFLISEIDSAYPGHL
jgi:hypothetical protein